MSDTQAPELLELSVEQKLDLVLQQQNLLGQQMNWLVDNLSSLFSFVGNVSQGGGGIRGLMKGLKDAQPPQIRQTIEQFESGGPVQ